jgi:hypothetical protein|tara:strand:+ start:1164 stop:1331 length:168 start_codon:yes stop_codon:yes gene_type:complete
MKIKTVNKQYAPDLNRKERRRLAKKIRADLQLEKNKIKKEKADSLESADDGRKSV